MKKILNFILVLFLSIALFSIATVHTIAADDYYASITATSGENLQEQLTSLIYEHNDIGYNGLWNAYKKTDIKPGTTNTIWDMYSNCNFDADKNRAGNYKKEGDAFNREHSVPQSWFSEASPMKADLFHVYPTDGYVNNRRSNFPFGEVSNPTYTSGNGSKLGKSSFEGYSGTVFEPIDEYKGDFARTYFYMSTCYANKVGGWGSGANVVFTGSFPHLTKYAVDLFAKWNAMDPVSEKEINRNNAVFKIQKNRNPFIDHPEYVAAIYDSKYNQEVEVDEAKVQNVINMINALPATITEDDQ